MQEREFDFGEQLAISSGFAAVADVKTILMQCIPGAVNVHAAATENDRQGVDWWIETNTSKHLSVDAKVRQTDWSATHEGQDDLALETWSVVEKSVIGWTRDPSKKCDYVLWLWKDTGRYCLVPFPFLCHVFSRRWLEWSERYKTRQQFTPRTSSGYHSECVFVPRRVVWAEIYRNYGGNLSVRSAA